MKTRARGLRRNCGVGKKDLADGLSSIKGLTELETRAGISASVRDETFLEGSQSSLSVMGLVGHLEQGWPF